MMSDLDMSMSDLDEMYSELGRLRADFEAMGGCVCASSTARNAACPQHSGRRKRNGYRRRALVTAIRRQETKELADAAEAIGMALHDLQCDRMSYGDAGAHIDAARRRILAILDRRRMYSV